MSIPLQGQIAAATGSKSIVQVAARSIRALVPSLLILVLLRLHAFSAPLEADECNYAYIGSHLLLGERLYVDVWDHHPPGMYTFLAGFIAVFGDAPQVFRWASLVAHSGILIAIYFLALRHFGWTCAWFASLLYALSSSDPGVAGEGCNREAYMNLLVMVAVCALTLPRNPRSWGWVVFAGCALGIASLFKTVIAAAWLALAIALFLETPRPPKQPFLKRLTPLLLFALGPALIWLSVAAYFASTDRWSAFADAVFGYNIEYSALDRNLFNRFVHAFAAWTNVRTNPALWVAGVVGVLTSVIWRSARFSRFLLWGTVGALASTALPGKPWSHYFQLLLPWAVIMALAPLAFLRSPAHAARQQVEPKPRFAPWIAWGYMLIVALLVARSQFTWYVSKNPADVSEIRYKGRDLWAHDQAALIQRVTQSDDSIFVWGNDPGLYYYSSRACASRFTMINALLGDNEATAKRRALLLEDLKEHKPRLILITHGPVAPEIDEYFRANYVADPGMDRNRMIVLVDPQRPIESVDWNWRKER